MFFNTEVVISMKYIAFLLLFLGSLPLIAQDYGSLGGRIVDEFTQDPIQQARLSLEIDGASVAQVTSNNQGDFFFNEVLDGYYDLIICKMGFSPVKISNVLITPDRHIVFNPKFEGEGFDQDTLFFSYTELQTPEYLCPFQKNQANRRIRKKQLHAARKLEE